MTLPVILQLPAERRASWRWRPHLAPPIAPRDMATSHIFNTLRMIWNNAMPPHMRVGQVKLFRFGPAYTPPYMREAIVHLTVELLERTDLTPQQLGELAAIAIWLRRMRGQQEFIEYGA